MSSELEPEDPQRVDRYSVLRRIGAGGMSQVYRAYDPELDRQIALKLVPFERLGDDGPTRLVREGRAIAKVNHPNVISVYEVGTFDESIYIAMELIEGPTIGGWVAELARPWTEIMRMYIQAGLGLSAAHKAGLVHRDFKPDNVMVGPDGRARVLDFGLARPAPLPGQGDDVLLASDTITNMSLNKIKERERPAPTTGPARPAAASFRAPFDLVFDVTRTGLVTGTPAYMAPEQHLGFEGGPAADQFSFCVSLWEALYRQRPFTGDSSRKIADSIIEGRLVEPPRTRVPGFVCHLLRRGLALEPEDRHPSVASLLASFVFTFKVMYG